MTIKRTEGIGVGKFREDLSYSLGFLFVACLPALHIYSTVNIFKNLLCKYLICKKSVQSYAKSTSRSTNSLFSFVYNENKSFLATIECNTSEPKSKQNQPNKNPQNWYILMWSYNKPYKHEHLWTESAFHITWLLLGNHFCLKNKFPRTNKGSWKLFMPLYFLGYTIFCHLYCPWIPFLNGYLYWLIPLT